MSHIFQGITADIIITDMPYGTTQCKWDTSVNLIDFWFMADAVCNSKAILFAQTPFDKILGASNINKLKYEIIWEKGNATGHLNAKKFPMKAHENILVFGSVPYYPQKTLNHPRKTANSYRSTDKSDCYGKQNAITTYSSTERYPRSVIKFSKDTQKNRYHPTQKPLALMEYLIKTYTKEGDTVFDPFMGSGTTGLACKNLGREFIGIEMDEKYFFVAQERLGINP